MEAFFFSSWESLLRTLVVGALVYVALVAFLRIAGKRTLAKLNAFDLVVTVALGSTLASALLSKDVALANGALAFALLIGLQFAVTWTGVRLQWVRRLVTGDPALLLYRGEFLHDALRRERVTEGEVHSAIRGAGLSVVEEVEAVVLETDGSISVLARRTGHGASSLRGVQKPADRKASAGASAVSPGTRPAG